MAIENNMARLAHNYANKNLSKSAFIARMRHEIKAAHIQGHLLAAGGRGNVGFVGWGSLGGTIKREYDFLDKFAEHHDPSAGRLRRMSPSYAENRARLYGRTSVKATYQRGLSLSHREAGYTHKRRVGPGDHATCATCRREIDAGWVPMDRKGWQIGHTECRIGDRCGIEYARFTP